MNRKQKKKDAREQSTRQLMGIDDFTDYGIATRMGNLVFFNKINAIFSNMFP